MFKHLLLIGSPILLASVLGCAVLHSDGRHLSEPLTGDHFPETLPKQAAVAPVAAVALVADALVVHPVLSVIPALWRSFKWSGRLLAVPFTGLKIALPDLLAYPIYAPFRVLGTAVAFPPLWLIDCLIPKGSEIAGAVS